MKIDHIGSLNKLQRIISESTFSGFNIKLEINDRNIFKAQILRKLKYTSKNLFVNGETVLKI